jgi:hypothetical protein
MAVRNGYIGSLASPSAGRVFYSYPKGALSPYPKRRRPVAILVHKDIGVNGQLAKANEALRRMSRQARDGP